MIFKKLSLFVTALVFTLITSQVVKAELFSDQGIPKETSELLAGLSFFEKFTEVESSDDLRSKYNLVTIALAEVAKHNAGTNEFKTALREANKAYNEFLEEYDKQSNKFKEIANGSYDEIFEAIDWSAAEFAACAGYRKELLNLLKANSDTVTANQLQGGSLSIELKECEARLNAAVRKLDQLIDSWEAEIVKKRETVAKLKEEHAKALADGNTELAKELQNEIDNIENEEIPKLERKIEKSKKVKGSFSFEKLLQGLGKITLGIITILFSGECGDDAQGACQNIGIGLIADGGKDVADAFDPPDETVIYHDIKTEDAKRSPDVVQVEDNIKKATSGKSEPLCCKPTDIKPEMILIKTDENGTLSFGYDLSNGKISKIYLIKNTDGSILAEIEDKLLFFKHGSDLPDLTTSMFSSLDKAETQKTDGGTHLVKFEGTLVAGGKAVLGIVISPLTFSGKFKVAFRPARYR